MSTWPQLYVFNFDHGFVNSLHANYAFIFPGLKKDRVTRVSQAVFDQGAPNKENRGGARVTDEMRARKDRIREHIESFGCRASHYALKDTPGRKYLPSELSVAKMKRLFIEQNHEQVL